MAWPEPIRAAEGAPNVIFYVLDDVGFGQLSPFGGRVRQPSLDRIADMGLRYTNMHTTAVCSPTRSCILTGRNHHSNGVAMIMEMATGWPGYDCRMPFENGMVSEMLREHGYNNFCLGKWHLSPAEENTAAGPIHRWPLGRGFDNYYGFLAGETNQWYPDLTQDNTHIEPPGTPEEGYHVSADLADNAIKMILNAHVAAPEKPFFMYYSTGCAHAPHHIFKEWADKYKGVFDDGWDAYRETTFARQKEMGIVPEHAVLPERDPDVPEWDSLSDDEKKLYTRMMEVYAGFLEFTDYHFGPPRVDRLAPSTRCSSSTTCRSRSKTTWPRSTSWVGPARTSTTHGAGRGLEIRRSAAGSVRSIAVALRIRSYCHGLPESKLGARYAPSTPTPSTWSQQCSTRWTSIHRKPSGV
jgi:arylsulfatase